ncbi:carbon-nitrogen family hydrolase [Streptomyces triticagri]|uniref:Carbon-nitrogen family hydrolase n=1 Tax=Streptomyces triticagri TaxID=2293568 RepID=A0A372M840_9ACTN|nr:carbon-nitrogen family hydrolase [Streptomyces triticagri]RFU87106.1 carbon-nitrogen family hydrolase [Streptomyces triticagri]
MRASLLQIAADPQESVNSRRQRVASLVREQAGADLVVLPELWTTGAFAYDAFATEAEELTGPTYEAMSAAAREAGVWLYAGSIVERAKDATGEERLYNTTLLLDPDGTLVRTYRKIHRFGFDKGEAVLMGAGTEPATAELPDTTIGLTTCYDLRFPELYRRLTDAGAETLVVAAGWPERRRAHWTLLAQARAVENQAYVLACGSAGIHADIEQAGHSIVVDPWGEVLAEAGSGEEVLSVEFDPAKVAKTREQFPALKDRRLGLDAPSHVAS